MNSYKDIKEEVSLAWTFLRWGVMLIVVTGLIAAVANAMGYASFAFWAPKAEQIRYNTFKESQSYNDGMIRDLENLQLEYNQANPDQKIAMKAIILHRFAVFEIDRLPKNLQLFYVLIQGT